MIRRGFQVRTLSGGSFRPGEGMVHLDEAKTMDLRLLKDRLESGSLKGVSFSARVFGSSGNSRFIKVPDEEFDALAAGFAGRPFLLDHRPSMASKIGRVNGGRATESEGERFIELDLELTDPDWAVKAARGLIEEFSVGLTSEREVCSVCNAEYEKFFSFSWPVCGHMPGRKYVSEDDTVVLCEVVMLNVRPLEVSSVWSGAYPNTQILSDEGSIETLTMLMEVKKMPMENNRGLEESKGPEAEESVEGGAPDAQEPEASDAAIETQEGEEGSTGEPSNVDSAQLAELQALREKNERMATELFSTKFDLAVQTGSVLPRYRAFFQKWVVKAGLEIFDEYVALSQKAPSNVSRQQLGSTAAPNAELADKDNKTEKPRLVKELGLEQGKEE